MQECHDAEQNNIADNKSRLHQHKLGNDDCAVECPEWLGPAAQLNQYPKNLSGFIGNEDELPNLLDEGV